MQIIFDFNPAVKICCVKFFFHKNKNEIQKNKTIHKNKNEIHKNKTLGRKPGQTSNFFLINS